MHRILLLLFFISFQFYGQSSSEIAEIYLVKSEEQLQDKELAKALVYFDKAKNLLGNESTAKMEEIGTMIYFQLENYPVAKEHAKNYFDLTTEKGTERYNEVLYLYVDIEEKIEAENKIKAELLAAEMLRKKEQHRIDSLTTLWFTKSSKLSFVADTIYSFDKNGVAIFKNDKGFYGVINDSGSELVSPGTYSNFYHNDGKIILMEGAKNQSSKVVVFKTDTKETISLPQVSDFNSLATNYGKVMLPRENNLVVMYPNNSKNVLVYDIDAKDYKSNSKLMEYYEYWKDHKVIKKFNKENQIKIDKDYLDFGGDLGGFSAFYNEDDSLFGFISLGGSILSSSQYKYLGTLNNGALEAITIDGTSIWLNEKGRTIQKPINKNGIYKGTIVLVKTDSKYQFVNEKNEIIKDGASLVSLDEFLKKY